MKPQITVIVPIYKVELYLRRCLDSIVSQTYQNLEIILVDDGSPDNCGKICDEYAEKDDRIRVIHQKNAGLGFARNSGLEICTGEYIMFVDSDDYLSTDCVEVLYKKLFNDNSDMVVGNYSEVYDDGTAQKGYYQCCYDCVMSRDDVLKNFSSHILPVTAWAKLYRREIFKNIAYPSIRCAEDIWVFSDVLEQCQQIAFSSKTVYFYFLRSDSIMHSLDQGRMLDLINANLRFVKYLLEKGCLKTASKFYARCVDCALSLEKMNDRLKFFKQYFDRKIRWQLFKETKLKTKIKWFGLFVPYVNRIRTIIASAKSKE